MALPMKDDGSKRSLGVRAQCLMAARSIISGSRSLKTLPDAQKKEILLCIDQTVSLLRALEPVKNEVADLLVRSAPS